jgi:DNA-binding GntR family transcriptional regulator
MRLLQGVDTLVTAAGRVIGDRSPAISRAAHREIFDAVRGHDADRAERLMREHLESVSAYLREAPADE